jgi:hypothetical protein
LALSARLLQLDRVRQRFAARALPTWPGAPHSQSRCAAARDCNDPRSAPPSGGRPSSIDKGTPGRTHSPFSDWCQRSILPFDCG